MYGLRDSDLEWVSHLLQKYPSVYHAFIFGSRAVGKFRNGSDVDIALSGSGLTAFETRQIKMILEEESPMPFFFDVVRVEGIADEVFMNKIIEVGKRIYSRDSKFPIDPVL